MYLSLIHILYPGGIPVHDRADSDPYDGVDVIGYDKPAPVSYTHLDVYKRQGSAYDLATVTDTPVILVIDAHGMGRSILPLIAGFLSYDTIHLIRGIILNRTSGAFFETIRPEICLLYTSRCV